MHSKLNRHEVAEVLSEVGMLMELKGENPFKVRAYHNAARMLDGLTEELDVIIDEGRLESLQGIGKNLSAHILELAKTGKLKELVDLKKDFPAGVLDLLKVPGLGPKKVKTLHEKLHIKSLGELEYACKENRLLKLEGFGEKTQAKVLEGITFVRKNQGQFLYSAVIDIAEGIVEKMSGFKEIKEISVAGSLRRRKEIVRDIDLVCSSEKATAVMKKFTSLDGVGGVISQGDTKASIHWKNGLQIDLRVVSPAEYPYALHHFTGSKEHNTQLRSLAKDLGLKMNEYGLFKGEKLVRCRDEEEIFKALGLHYIPPELREGMGEIEASKKGDFPPLLETSDIRGSFHVHSTYSDGRNTLEEMVSHAARLRWEYIGISDHSQSAFYANGMKEADIDRQHREIDSLQKKFPKMKIFKGVESDILPDGSLDYPDRVLKKFDFVIASVHSHFNMTEEEMTKRCIKALENPRCTMIGHPTGRLLLGRDGFKVNLQALIDKAHDLGKAVELNANPHRLDLDWRVLKYAKEKEVQVSINPDAHSLEGLSHIRYGVNIARKAGLTRTDVFNSVPASMMEKIIGTHH